jgi:hypothetical protein
MGRWMKAAALAALAAGCGPVLHAEMLGESMRAFSPKLRGNDKIWIAGPGDSDCHTGCQSCGGKEKSALGGLFGAKSGPSAGPYDQLAYEVFSNFITQRKKGRVVETHRHNYATELNPETHRKVDVTSEGTKVATTSCEDLCLLDEAKKRKADKVLAYHIQEMKADEMTIHFRLSDVPTGLIEAAQTLKVVGLRAVDVSLGAMGSARQTSRSSED